MLVKKLEYYEKENGKSPFLEWINQLGIKEQVIIDRFIKRVAQGGGKKAIKSLKDGVSEIKVPYEPGYRIYFAEAGNTIIVLLIGGDKGSQGRDIEKAKEYWSEYAKTK